MTQDVDASPISIGWYLVSIKLRLFKNMHDQVIWIIVRLVMLLTNMQVIYFFKKVAVFY